MNTKTLRRIPMPKQVMEYQHLKKIQNKLMDKIAGKTACKEGENVVNRWLNADKTIRAGQISGTKILPNGNKQYRTTTVYTGIDPMIITDTRVFLPSGMLYRAYCGIRVPESIVTNSKGKVVQHIKPTKKYENTGEGVQKLIKEQVEINPRFKYHTRFH